eukprot:GHVN01103163.1.p1 GENE.GHVN01103163.1~~GHVN01103163.1.p1  ORF type:complete len:130 (+),score=10.96 GHVN01103163.1:665-1054(+)
MPFGAVHVYSPSLALVRDLLTRGVHASRARFLGPSQNDLKRKEWDEIMEAATNSMFDPTRRQHILEALWEEIRLSRTKEDFTLKLRRVGLDRRLLDSDGKVMKGPEGGPTLGWGGVMINDFDSGSHIIF